MTGTAEGVTRVIDAKFPITWLVGCSSAIVFSMGGMFVQLKSVVESTSEIKSKLEIRDERTNTISQTLVSIQGDNRTQQAQIDRTASDIAEIKRDVEEMKRKQTWAPR